MSLLLALSTINIYTDIILCAFVIMVLSVGGLLLLDIIKYFKYTRKHKKPEVNRDGFVYPRTDVILLIIGAISIITFVYCFSYIVLTSY